MRVTVDGDVLQIAVEGERQKEEGEGRYHRCACRARQACMHLAFCQCPKGFADSCSTVRVLSKELRCARRVERTQIYSNRSVRLPDSADLSAISACHPCLLLFAFMISAHQSL